MQELDRRAIEDVGIPAVCLMENAGRALADEAAGMLKRRRNRRVVVVCGPGNNGGDGLVAARHLVNAGFSAGVLFVGTAAKLGPDAALNYHVAKKLRIPFFKPDARGCRMLRRAGLIIDALFGIGLAREVREPFKGVIKAMNDSPALVLAADILCAI